MPRFLAPAILALLAACQAPPQAPEEAAAAEPAAPRPTEGSTPSADGVPIAYSVAGDGATAVVLIHGWSCDRTYWRQQIEPLAAGYRVVSVDLAGHGDSGQGRATWSLPAFGEDVRAVADALGLERMVLVGHSMGAPVALEAARLLGGRVLGVVAVDALQDVSSRPDPEQWRGVVESYANDFAGTCREFVGSMFLDGADPGIVEATVADMCSGPPEIGTELMRRFGEYDQAAAIRQVAVPVRAINSRVYPTDLEGNREVAADFEARFYEGAGHFPMLVIPEELNRQLLEVLAELAP